MSLKERLNAPGPKRILARDGGGIRGALTMGYLKQIEDILRKQHGDDPAFRLCDYFDLIGGTSTGSIIASCLAIGMKVSEIRDSYFDLGGKIFAKKYKWDNKNIRKRVRCIKRQLPWPGLKKVHMNQPGCRQIG